MKTLATLIFVVALPILATASDEGTYWHTTRSGRFNTLLMSMGGAGSIGRATRHDRIEIGVEAIGILIAAEDAHLALGAGPYMRVRPIPSTFGRRFFVHVAGYGGVLTPDDAGFAPSAFLAFESPPKEGRESSSFFGLGLEGFVFGTRW